MFALLIEFLTRLGTNLILSFYSQPCHYDSLPIPYYFSSGNDTCLDVSFPLLFVVNKTFFQMLICNWLDSEGFRVSSDKKTKHNSPTVFYLLLKHAVWTLLSHHTLVPSISLLMSIELYLQT